VEEMCSFEKLNFLTLDASFFIQYCNPRILTMSKAKKKPIMMTKTKILI
jgi:hypothetical protein